MVIGPVEVVMHVAMLKGLKRMDDGSMVKDYAVIPGAETDFAAQTIVYEVASEDQRFLESAATDVTEEFPIDSRAFYLGDFNYGRPLIVMGHNGEKMSISLLTEKGKEPPFGHQIAEQVERENPYIPSFQVARMLGMNPLVLSKITSSFSVMVDGERQNLGLNLKFEGKKLKVLDYSRKRGNGWEFSNKTIALLREYKQKFPEFFNALQRNPQGDIYDEKEFYPAGIVKQKMTEIREWLKSVQSKGSEKVPLDAQQMDGDTIRKIEAAVDTWLKTQDAGGQKAIHNVPRKALLKPSDAEYRCSDQKFTLGDRVVYVQDSGKVPIASRGTVVGITQTTRLTLLDVVWDSTFMSGTTLSDRCSPFRGSTVPVGSVLNLTNRQVIAMSTASMLKLEAQKAAQKAAKPSFPTSAPNPGLLTGGYRDVVSGRGGHGGRVNGHNGHQNIQVNGRGNYPLPILPGPPSHQTPHHQTPPPPQGIYSQNQRGAVHSAFRGGNSGRGGFQPSKPPVIMQRPPNQNSTPTHAPPGALESPKDYKAVAPPANLNRGRGRGTPRGGTPRGGVNGRGGGYMRGAGRGV